MAVHYSSYLQLDKLLTAQEPLSENEHDEMLFIIIHQSYELWFKQILHEGGHLKKQFREGNIAPAHATLHRLRTILKTLVGQIDILETMTPLSFASFRARLESASGFQSMQFRQVEILFGIRRATTMLEHYSAGSPERKQLEELLEQPSIYDHFLKFLHFRGYPIPPELLERKWEKSYEPNETVQDIIFQIYQRDPSVAQLCESLIDVDEGMQEWRYRHIKMVERTIGAKPGTGGSLGANYLKSTLFQPLFSDLWAVRNRF